MVLITHLGPSVLINHSDSSLDVVRGIFPSLSHEYCWFNLPVARLHFTRPGGRIVENDECLLEKNNILIKALPISLQVRKE